MRGRILYINSNLTLYKESFSSVYCRSTAATRSPDDTDTLVRMVLLFISKTNAPHLKTEVLDVVSAEYQYIGNLNFVINVSLKVKFDRKVFNIVLRFSSLF